MTANQLKYQSNLIEQAKIDEERRKNLVSENVRERENIAKYGTVTYPLAGEEYSTATPRYGFNLVTDVVTKLLNPISGLMKLIGS